MGVAFIASRSRRWALFVLAGPPAALATGFAQLCGFAALVAAYATTVPRRANRLLGAVVGALAAQTMLRLPTSWPARTSALLVAACIVPAALSGWRGLRRHERRLAKQIALGLGVFAFLWMWILVLATVSARSKVELGIARTREAVAAARSGDTQRASELFAGAARAFDEAHTGVGAWYLQPARILPAAGLQLRALLVATEHGHDLADVASASSRSADVQAVRMINGQVDLAAVRAMREPLANAVTALHEARASLADSRGVWIVPPLARRLDEFFGQVASADDDASVAADAIDVLPALLGGSETRNYLLLFTTPSETRGAGGFVGDFGQITASNGNVKLTRSGQIHQLNDRTKGPKTVTGPPEYLNRYQGFNVGQFFQNVTASPDFRDVAAVARQLYPQAPGGQPIDGVILVDPYAIAAILKLTGPVTVEGFDEPLTTANAVELLLREQYFKFDSSPADTTTGTEQRYDFLEAATRATFDALTTRTTVPSPRSLVDLLSGVALQRRLAAYSALPREQAFFERVHLDGAFPSPNGGDLVGMVSTNDGANKLDGYLHRSLDYDVTFDPASNAVSATATVKLSNLPPAGPLPTQVNGEGGPPSVGTNKTWLTLYSPLELQDASLNGSPVSIGRADEFGMHTYTAIVAIPRDQTITLTFDLRGVIRPGDYRLTVARQPLAWPDHVHVVVRAKSGRVKHATGLTIAGDQAVSEVDVNEDMAVDATIG
ncbi:MAG: hypothetical protein QOH79_1804 [Acidimicrobiaceae bacterium]